MKETFSVDDCIDICIDVWDEFKKQAALDDYVLAMRDESVVNSPRQAELKPRRVAAEIWRGWNREYG